MLHITYRGTRNSGRRQYAHLDQTWSQGFDCLCSQAVLQNTQLLVSVPDPTRGQPPCLSHSCVLFPSSLVFSSKNQLVLLPLGNCPLQVSCGSQLSQGEPYSARDSTAGSLLRGSAGHRTLLWALLGTPVEHALSSTLLP